MEFDEAKADYERALGNAGYSAELKYDAEHNRTTRASRKRKRRIVWYNPPFSKNVATNIGREFFKLLQLHFPKQHPFHCIFNKNTVKLSYSCTTNMDNIVKAHNAKTLSKDENPGDAKDCNCRDRTACPVANKCLTTNVVYKATVKYEDKTQYYVGMTENSFKTRYTQHKSSIKHTKNRNQTELSSLLWSLADKGTDYKLTWILLIEPGHTGQGNAHATFACPKNSTSSLVRTLSTRRPSCSTSAPTAENSWRETTSHSFPRSCLTSLLTSPLTSLLTLVNTVLCVCI